jgi:hypothetical protein
VAGVQVGDSAPNQIATGQCLNRSLHLVEGSGPRFRNAW